MRDDSRIGIRRLGTVRIKLFIHCLEFLDECVLAFLGDKHIVGRDACLARVDRLAPEDAASSEFEVCLGINDDGAFTSELVGVSTCESHSNTDAHLESHGGQMLGCSSGYNASDIPSASVEDMAPWEVEETSRLGYSPVDDGNDIGIEVFGNKRCDE